MKQRVETQSRRPRLELLEDRCLLSSGYGIDFALYTDDDLSTPGLTGSYVNQNLRHVNQLDWRVTQSISGVRTEQVFFPSNSLGSRAEVGVTGGSDGDWDNFSVQWDGVIEVHGGDVDFAMRSDDGSRLWIDVDQNQVFDDDELVETNWGTGGGAIVGPRTPKIQQGVYDIRIQFEEDSGANSVSLIANPIQPVGAFAVYTDMTRSTPGLTGSYVNQNLRGVNDQDWRITRTVSGTRVDGSLEFPSSSWGTRADVGLTAGSDADWDNFSVQWDGVVEILENGTTLATRSDDGSRMWIDVNENGSFESSELVDNNWGNGQAPTLGNSSASMDAGLYAIRIQYEEGFGGNVMQLVPGAPRVVRVAYLIPSNRSPQADGVANLQDLMPRMQAWYREQMDRNGFGPKTFHYETEADGATPKIHLVGLGVDDQFIKQDFWNNSGNAAAAAGVRNWATGEIWLMLPEAHQLSPDGSNSGAGGALGAGFGSGDDPGVALGGSDFIFRAGADMLWNESPYHGAVASAYGPYQLVQDVSFPWFEGSTFSSIASAAQGALAHELGHAFGLWHDGRNDRNYHGNLQGNGLRGLRGHAHPQLFPGEDMRLAYATALALNQSRYFNRDQTYVDNTAPNLNINTSGSAPTVNGLVQISFSADDPSGLALALLRHSGRGETVGEMALNGTSVSRTFATTFYDNPGGTDGYTISVYDTQGNRRDASVSLNVVPPANRAPRPFVLAFHSTAVAGAAITLDASSSSDPDDPASSLTVEWDLHYDGVFDTSPTTSKSLTTTFSEGTHMVAARLTDPAGNQTVSAPLAIRIHPLGDFDLDNALGAGDLAMLQNAVAKNIPDPQFNLNGDAVLSQADVDFWLSLQSADADADADFDQDDDVDGGDFLAWQRGFATPNAMPGDGDADGDLDVDGDDLDAWKFQFGSSGSPGDVAAGPAPLSATTSASLETVAVEIQVAESESLGDESPWWIERPNAELRCGHDGPAPAKQNRQDGRDRYFANLGEGQRQAPVAVRPFAPVLRGATALRRGLSEIADHGAIEVVTDLDVSWTVGPS